MGRNVKTPHPEDIPQGSGFQYPCGFAAFFYVFPGFTPGVLEVFYWS